MTTQKTNTAAGTRRIFRMTNDSIYINDTEKLPLSQTNLPARFISFKSYMPVFWEVLITKSDTGNGKTWIVEVQNYNVGHSEAFPAQSFKRSAEGIFLQFQNLNYNAFEGCLASWSPNKIPKHLFAGESLSERFGTRKAAPNITPLDMPVVTTPAKRSGVPVVFKLDQPVGEQILERTFRVQVEEVTFCDGYAAMLVRFDQPFDPVAIKIINPYLLADYDSIKPYFFKRLNRTRLSLRVAVTVRDGQVIRYSASCDDLYAIDGTFIQMIRIERIRAAVRLEASGSDGTLLSAGELMNRIEGGNALPCSIEEIIAVVTNQYTHRNSAQLRYLSDIHDFEVAVIRITPKPHLGFIFLVEGRGELLAVWELLNSNATYIWRYPSGTTAVEAYSAVQEEIRKIFLTGRNPYKTGTPPANFIALEHRTDNKGKPLLEPWRLRLESCRGVNG